jgi:RNA polymerase sigma factor (sigma-70 family)
MKTIATTSATQAELDKKFAKIMQTGSKAEAQKAFGEIYKRYKAPLFFKVIMKAVNNKEVAEDLEQEIFAKIFMNIGQYNFSTALSTWMFNIAQNHVVDYIRTQKYEILSIEGLKTEYGSDDDVSEMFFQIEDKSEDTFKSVVRNERAEAVLKALEDGVSSADGKKVIRMIYLEELSYEEVSEKMNMSLGTVKSLMFRAKGEMKKFLSRKCLDFTYVN